MDAALDSSRPHGQARLLAHFAALDQLDDTRPSPLERLERAVGSRLARLLVVALAGDHRARLRVFAG
jgi:hypothetical protein